MMSTNGILLQGYKILLGHPGFMTTIFTWGILCTIVIVALKLYEESH
jgi:hypothetical protein